MAMKMTIEYDIYGRTQEIPASIFDNEQVIEIAKTNAELDLRREAVFGKIKHQMVPPRKDIGGEFELFGLLHSSGMRFLREVKDGD